MRICFINPAPRSYIIERGHETTGAYPPLGILYIMAYLKKEGYECILIDQHATKEPIVHVLRQVRRYDPDIVAFNTLTDINMGKRATYIAKVIKDWNPNLKIVFGNYHASFNHERILRKYPFVDICVRGEGEVTFYELVKSIEKNLDLKDVLGITYKSNGRIRINPDRPLIEDLDGLPFPDRAACDDIRYLQNYGGFNADYGKFTTIQSSRGCTYNCSFCCISKLSQRRWRARSIKYVIDELEHLASEGYSNLYWVDDNFTLNPRRAVKLFRAIQKNKLKFVWICDQRVDQVSNSLLYEMKRAGCKSISFGIESANQRILNYLNKKITPKVALKATKKAKKMGIEFIMGTFVVGLPTETLDEIKKTFYFAQKLDIDLPQFHIFGAIPGTKIWDDLVRDGRINPDKYWENGVKVLDPPLDIVENQMERAYINFFNRPKFIIDQFFRTVKSSHRWRIILSNAKILAGGKKDFQRIFDFLTRTWTHGDLPNNNKSVED
ncbi:MAG: B12-binding domain-containing radical SAM protein [Candidatus Helarchaeota archaeon]